MDADPASFIKVASVVSAFVVAVIGYIAGSMKFGREKRWEIKYAAYKDIMKDLWSIYSWSSRFDYDEEGGQSVASNEQDKEFWIALHSVKKHILLGELVISSRVTKLLKQF